MKLYKLTLRPQSSFMTPLKGDTLFGQLCWQIRETHGNDHLEQLLEGYTEQRPFAVISDAFTHNTLPMPNVPMHLKTQLSQANDVKKLKKIKHVSTDKLQQPLNQWLDRQSSETTAQAIPYQRMHNSINRLTNSTGGEGFSPFTLNKYTYPANTLLDCYLALDEQRLPPQQAQHMFETIGLIGFGRKANTGHGKFSVESLTQVEPHHPQANAYLTLAPARVKPQGWIAEKSYYQLFTRFGRHGIQLVHNQPFKQPVMMMDTGALLTPQHYQPTPYIGTGLSGVSQVQPNAVQQAYSPVIGILLAQ